MASLIVPGGRKIWFFIALVEFPPCNP